MIGISRKTLFISGVGVVFVLIYLSVSLTVGLGVRDVCVRAQEKYGDGCVSSLIEMVEDDTVGVDEKNKAVWALGQLGDTRALVHLRSILTNKNTKLSKYELNKAIGLLEGGVNFTAPLWRNPYILSS